MGVRGDLRMRALNLTKQSGLTEGANAKSFDAQGSNKLQCTFTCIAVARY